MLYTLSECRDINTNSDIITSEAPISDCMYRVSRFNSMHLSLQLFVIRKKFVLFRGGHLFNDRFVQFRHLEITSIYLNEIIYLFMHYRYYLQSMYVEKLEKISIGDISTSILWNLWYYSCIRASRSWKRLHLDKFGDQC